MDTVTARPAPALPRILGPIRPRPRWQEARLLLLVAFTLLVGSVSLGATVTGSFVPADAGALAIYLAALAVAHGAQVLAGRRTDQVLLPVVGLLGGIGLAILSSGLLALAMLPAAPSALDIGWRMAACGIGFGFFQAPNMKAIMGSAPPGRSGSASGMVATARLTGQATGAALVALCLTLSHARGPAHALVLGAVFAQNPRLRGYVLDDQGALRRHMMVFVDGQQIRDREALSDAVGPASEVYVMQALSGGR